MKYKDITNKKFGKLTAIKPIDINSVGQVRWLCKCDCGKEKVICGSSLRGRITQSCGCLQKEVVSNINRKDITNKRFGKLLVIKRLEIINKNNSHLWEVKCDCGNIKQISTSSLISGNSKSCGCLQRETVSSRIGELSGRWNKNLSNYDREKYGRKIHKYSVWTKSIFKKDNWTCQSCGQVGGKLNAHHKNGWHWDIKNRYKINNGITLCKNCHKDFHKVFGNRNNNYIQSFIYTFAKQAINN